MNKDSNSCGIFGKRCVLSGLILAVVLQPIGMALLLAFGRFFSWTGDLFSSRILDGVALGIGVLWLLSLVWLLLFVALIALKSLNDKGD